MKTPTPPTDTSPTTTTGQKPVSIFLEKNDDTFEKTTPKKALRGSFSTSCGRGSLTAKLRAKNLSNQTDTNIRSTYHLDTLGKRVADRVLDVAYSNGFNDKGNWHTYADLHILETAALDVYQEVRRDKADDPDLSALNQLVTEWRAWSKGGVQ